MKFLIFITLLFSTVSFAAELTVTSAADSGAGTLRDTIGGATAGDSIIFANTISLITLTSGEIDIDLNISIDGGGDVEIDGNANSRIFCIRNNSTISVLIQNLTLKNGFATTRNGGGAIFSDDENLTLSNCVFAGNSYIRNLATRGGGAIYNHDGFLNIVNCTITNNSATGTSNDGGGVFAGRLAPAKVFIDNCIIKDNYSIRDGGGIYINNGFLSITNNTELTDNQAGDDGGGLCINSVNVTFSIDEKINFYNNSAGDNGGGIYFTEDSEVIITNCNFFGNNAEDLGGAICANNSTDFKLYNSVFTNNFSKSANGGALHCNLASSTTLIYNCEFENNFSPNRGGAIFHNGSVKINDSYFYSNAATNRGGGACIYQANILNTDFTNNITVRANNDGGGALYTFGNTTISNCNFLNNSANANAGAFRINSATAKVNIFDCEFRNNSARNGGGGGLHANAAASLKIKNSSFINNSATADGGGVWAYQTYMSVFITNSVFENNSAGDDAGALYISGTSSVINCSFTKSSATDSGGAIACFANSSFGKIINCNFFTNSANTSGGSAWIQGNWMIDNCSVISNTTVEDGGGFYFTGANASTINLFNCDFSFNSAGDDGGGIYCDAASYVSNCIFLENYTAERGGGVYCSAGSVIQNSIFKFNQADGFGGGILCDNGGLVQNSLMQNNLANDFGGGVCLYQDGGIVSNCVMRNNNASGGIGSGGGGAYCFEGGEIYNCEFFENSADNDGGGVLIQNPGNIIVDSCIIRNNVAGDWGGGVNFYYNGNAILRNSLIINNDADEGGGIYCYQDGSIQNCTIAGNFAISDGGGVKFSDTNPDIINSIIYNNSSTDANFLNYSNINGTYCCTFPELTGTGNITNNPLFISLSDDDFHLSTNSPCVDVGNNQAWMTSAKDLDGNERIVNSNVDMGCYELSSLYCFFDANKTVGGVPLNVTFTSYVSGTNTTSIYYYWDFNNDGIFDVQGLSSNSPSFNYTNAGVYSVYLIVSNFYGETADCLRQNYIVVANPRYVALNGKHITPFNNWANAASNIQAAVDISGDEMRIIVSNGFFYLPDQVLITNSIKIESFKGRNNTFIVPTNSSRAFYLTQGASLHGFTFSNGFASGSADAGNGGAVFCYFGGLISNCIFVANKANKFGGGVFLNNDSSVIFSSFVSNNAERGGAAYCDSGGFVFNCIITNNSATYRGGGIYCYNQGKVRSSLIAYNYAVNNGGGISMFRSGGVVDACTISKNHSGNRGGGIYSHDGGKFKNSIIFFNTATVVANSNWFSEIIGTDYGRELTYCNTAPIAGLPAGSGNNINSNPQFVSVANDNFRLQPISLCIDSGNNSTWMTNTLDLDENPRIINGTVNRGAYESSATPVIIIDFPVNNFVFPFKTIYPIFFGETIGVDGNIWFSNYWKGGLFYDSFPSAAHWSNNIHLPKYGDYSITFHGTNYLGNITNVTVNVNRKRSQIFIFD